MVYLLPITKSTPKSTPVPFLKLNVPEDIIADSTELHNKYLILDKALYLRPQRLLKVIGKAQPQFLKKVLSQLPETFDFTRLHSEIDFDTTSIMDVEDDIETIAVEETIEAMVEDDTETIENIEDDTEIIENIEDETETIENIEDETETIEVMVEETSNIKPTIIHYPKNWESALLEEIGTALEKLDKSKNPEEQIVSFLTEIDMPTNQLVIQTFLLACNVKKINFENLILELRKFNPELKEVLIKRALRKTFTSWLKQHPTIVEKYPKISITSLVKLFAKRFR